MQRKIGVLARLEIREAWPHEAYDFTTWMQQNIGILGDAVGIDFDSAEKEQPAGTFSADIVAVTGDGRTVVVENQFGKSDHDHLGKLITYLVAFDADCAIWIVEEARPEHIAAITWLNEQGSIDAFLVKAQAIRIDDSAPAPLFTRIVGPDEETKQRGEQKQQLRERHLLRHEFWSKLIPVAVQRHTLPTHTTAGYRTWLGTGSGIPGLSYNYGLTREGTKAELYIDRGDRASNEGIFEHLKAHKDSIAQEVATKINWDPMNGRRGCRIAVRHTNQGYVAPEGDWPALIEEMVGSMVLLKRALEPHLSTIASM